MLIDMRMSNEDHGIVVGRIVTSKYDSFFKSSLEAKQKKTDSFDEESYDVFSDAVDETASFYGQEYDGEIV